MAKIWLAGLRNPHDFAHRAGLSDRSPRIEAVSAQGAGLLEDLETHRHAVALHFGVYNFVRKHHTLGTTPAVAAGIEEKAWDLEHVVDITAAYFERKSIAAKELIAAGSL